MTYVLPNSIQWDLYCPTQKAGRLCFHYCIEGRSALPVRNVDKEDITEPNYETATYNYYRECYQKKLRCDVRKGISHLLFFTRYLGTNHQYYCCHFIVGYYEIGWTTEINGGIAIKAKKLCFVSIDNAYKITDEWWQRFKPDDPTPLSCRPTVITQRVNHKRIYGNPFDEIVQHFDKQHNRVDDYRFEVDKLSK